MLSISDEALHEGCDRARDLFMLARLQGPADAPATFAAFFEALGVDPRMRADLERAVADIVPVEGAPALEAAATLSMLSGVLIGLLVADSAMPSDTLDLPTAQTWPPRPNG